MGEEPQTNSGAEEPYAREQRTLSMTRLPDVHAQSSAKFPDGNALQMDPQKFQAAIFSLPKSKSQHQDRPFPMPLQKPTG